MEISTASSVSSASASEVALSGVSSRPPTKTRSACNRCHSQKLRCVRKTGQTNCERCARLHVICRFGPRAVRSCLNPPDRIKNWHQSLSVPASIPKPSVQTDSTFEDLIDDWMSPASLGMSNFEGRVETISQDFPTALQNSLPEVQEMEWPEQLTEFVDLDLTPVKETTMILSGNYSSLGHWTQDRDADDFHGGSPTLAVQRLASLNVALHECAAKIPSVSKVEANTTRHDVQTTVFAFEELFRLTTDFINVIQCLSLPECNTIPGPAMTSVDPESLCFQQALPLHPYAEAVPSNRCTSTHPLSYTTEATLLLLASTHTRLTSIYISIFEKTRACIERSLIPQLGPGWAVVLPRLQFGSLATPAITVDINTPLGEGQKSLYMLMFTMLAGQLWIQVAELMAVEQTYSAPTAGSGLTDMVWQSIRERNQSLARTIEEVRVLLQR